MHGPASLTGVDTASNSAQPVAPALLTGGGTAADPDPGSSGTEIQSTLWFLNNSA